MMRKFFTLPMTLISLGSIIILCCGHYFPDRTGIIFFASLIVAIGGFLEKSQSSADKEKFEKQLNEKNNKIIEQAEYIRESINGGDSYCILSFGDMGENNTITPFIKNAGKYRMQDVSFNLHNLTDKFNTYMKLNCQALQYDVGNLAPGATKGLQPFPIRDEKLVRLRADIGDSSCNYATQQMIHFRKSSDGVWLAASTVFRYNGIQTEVLYEDIPDFFPVDENGKYDWNRKDILFSLKNPLFLCQKNKSSKINNGKMETNYTTILFAMIYRYLFFQRCFQNSKLF